MKKIIASLCLLCITVCIYAQDHTLTMEDAFVKNRTTLAPENLKQLQFVYGTNDYVYLKKDGDKEYWMKGNTAGEESFLTLDKLNSDLVKSGIIAVTTMPAIQFNISSEAIMTVGGNRVALDLASGIVRTIISKIVLGNNIAEDNRHGLVAYVQNSNLFVSDGINTKKITQDGNSDIVYASSVHREEFGINKGIFWSNTGKKMAFYRMDQSMVTDYPIVDWSVRPAKNTNIKYPMAGDKSHHVTVGIYNTETKGVTWIKTGEPAEKYLTNICWSPDDRYVYIAVVNRGQDQMELNQYDATTGMFLKTLFEERDSKYVEPLVPMLFLKSDPSHFIWQSMRDGWNHLYLYDANGKLLKQITKGDWNVTEVKGFDTKGENIYYVSTQESPLSKNLYAVNLTSGEPKKITQGPGVHNTIMSTSGDYVADNYSNVSTPRSVVLIETATGKAKTLLTAADPLAGYTLGKMTVFTIKSNGTDIYCRMFTPVNFDSSKKYPVIAYWYGGPHAQVINAGWNGGSADYWFQAMAEKGYIVFSLDTRGSANRGKQFEQSMFRKFGDVQMEDMKAGVNYLTSLPYVDTKNMGLLGWSFGGFMTIDYMLHYPGDFKAAVAGGPVTDWKYYEIMYTERYMDTPKENPEGYGATDLTAQVGNLKGNLLLIHGLQDGTVVQQHSVRFVRAAIDKNIQVDYMIYPGHEHNVLGKDRAHLYQKITDYFMQHLQSY